MEVEQCLGFGDCGLGYAVWEKNSRDGSYAPKFFSDEVVWSYKNVTFVGMIAMQAITKVCILTSNSGCLTMSFIRTMSMMRGLMANCCRYSDQIKGQF